MNSQFSRLLPAAAVVLALAACGGAPPTPESGAAPSEPSAAAPAGEMFQADPATAASVAGKIAFEGEAPKPQRLNLGADEDCKALHADPLFSEQTVVNENGTLRNVFVYVKKGLEGKAFPVPSEKVAINQDGCVYVPHVVGLMVGQTLAVGNSDPTLHNVHPLPRTNVEWNKSQAAGAAPIEETFSKPELMIPIKCNIHPWMRAYVNVVPHPFFAVTGADGSFEIRGLPPGEYTLEAAHERLGTQEMQVTVGPSEAKAVDFSFKG